MKTSYSIAVNLRDLEGLTDSVIGLLSNNVDLNPIPIDKNGSDELVLRFNCNLISASCICDHLRSLKDQIRIYIKRQRWSKLPVGRFLSIVERGEVILNPEAFPQDEELLPLVPLASEEIF